MNRIFFIAGTLIGVMVLVMTVMMTSGNISANEQVEAGYTLWQTYSCESCHTLYGQGGSYAPDLTHIYTLRGAPYIRDFMVNPAAYHPNQRLMPRFTIDQDKVEQLIALFEWTSETEPVADVWPPNTIQVAGSAGLNINAVEHLGSVDNENPLISQGQTIYSQRCASCHSIAEGVVLVGPSFWGIVNRAAERVDGQSAEAYLRTSILYPSDYIVEGFQDVMQKNFAEVLSSQDINAVIAFLMSFDNEVSQ